MTRQTWTAAVSALLFILSAAVVALVPVPFVTYAPGDTHNLLGALDSGPVVEIDGVTSNPPRGQVLKTTGAVSRSDAAVTLPEALYAHWVGDHEVFPRDSVYPPGVTTQEIRAREDQLMAGAEAASAAAALRAAGVEVRQVPMVQSVASAGPAVDRLFPGDFIVAVDGVATPTVAAVRQEIERRSIGESVTFTVVRDREELSVTVDTVASKTQVGVPVWGGNLVMGYSYAPKVTFTLESGVGGDSAGLMMALAVFDRVTPEDVVGDRVIAGTGAIDGAGNIAGVGGVRVKVRAAQAAGATVFLVPEANCSDLTGVSTPLRIVSVTTLDDAIGALDALADPATEGLVRGCT